MTMSAEDRLPLATRMALALAYARPLAWHPAFARVLGVTLAPAPTIDVSLLSSAEESSAKATRYLLLQIAVAVVGCTLGPLVTVSVWVAATAGAFALGVLAPDVIALLVWAAIMVPMLVVVVMLGRRAAMAGVPAISVALKMLETGERPDLSPYPRIQYAIGRLVPSGSGGS